MISKEIIDSLRRYVEKGIPTGGFLQAVLENDLMGSFGRADKENRGAMWEICNYVYNDIPSSCHGSPEKVKAWLNKFKEARLCDTNLK